jgi:hypothetical protein
MFPFDRYSIALLMDPDKPADDEIYLDGVYLRLLQSMPNLGHGLTEYSTKRVNEPAAAAAARDGSAV